MTVYTSLIGGLGNQMFQYAAGRALALRRNTPLRLDISSFSSYRIHQGFELQRVFACTAETAGASDINRLLGWQSRPFFRRLLAHPAFSALRRNEFVVEPHFNFWPGIDEVPMDCYLAGYWQSEKYFRDQAPTIRQDFTFRQPLSGQNQSLADMIARENAISLHVRRGDYASNPQSNATHGTCSPDYYRAAVRYVAERTENPHFWIFSDDMAWTKEQLKLDFPCRYVEHNQGAESYNDMRLMTLCRHHVIANSSFSWWGAWLAAHPARIVVAPERWFRGAPHDSSDLIPENWVRL
jgi:hypothetical protein